MSIEVREVLSERKYKAGYVLKKELWEHGDEGPTEMHSGYTPSGDYIGDTKWAYQLCKVRGIMPEKRTLESSVCSIGFCEREQKWYGWSHRAIFGFAIGSEVKRGDCAYHPTDKEDFLLDMVGFWADDHHLDVQGEHTVEDGMPGVHVTWTYDDRVRNKKIRGTISGVFQPYPDSWGKGEWTATTLAEAREMAVDFAEGVG